MTILTETCKIDGKLSKDFKQAVRKKGSLLYLVTDIGLVKLPKAYHRPMVTCTYMVKLKDEEETQ